MDIRNIANTLSSFVNPNTEVTIRASNGYTVGTGAKQIPQYLPDVLGTAQLQAADEEFLKKESGLNLEAVYKFLYISGQIYGAVRLNDKGGDLVIINAEIWLTVKIIERWPLWCKILLCLQYQ